MNQDKQTEALRLAQRLEQFQSFPDDLSSAAELRRQHARISELEAELAAVQQKSTVVVPSTTSADDANAAYGEAYGVDWVYSAAKQGEQA